jgi:hypothetical protein
MANFPVTVIQNSVEIAQDKQVPQPIYIKEKVFKYWKTDVLRTKDVTEFIDTSGYNSFTIQFLGGGTSKFQVFGSEDLNNWSVIQMENSTDNFSPSITAFTPGASGNGYFYANKTTKFIKITDTSLVVNDGVLIQIKLLSTTFPSKTSDSRKNLSNAFSYISTPISAASTTIYSTFLLPPYSNRYITEVMVQNSGTTATYVTLFDGTNTLWAAYLQPGQTLIDIPSQLITVAGIAALTFTMSNTTDSTIYLTLRGYNTTYL